MIDLFQQLLEDPTYKNVIKDLSEEDKAVLEEYMKRFMGTMQDNLLAPFSNISSNPKAVEEFNKEWKKKKGGK